MSRWDGAPGAAGERGKTGDHGQTGAAGAAGADGARGRDGAQGRDGELPIAYYEDPAVNKAIAQALGEKRVRWYDRRLLIMFVVLVVCLAGVFQILESQTQRIDLDARTFRTGIINNCLAVRANAARQAAVLDQLVKVNLANKTRTRAENEQIAAVYRSLRPVIPACPPARLAR